jgi:enediyne biosynthesis protein E4
MYLVFLIFERLSVPCFTSRNLLLIRTIATNISSRFFFRKDIILLVFAFFLYTGISAQTINKVSHKWVQASSPVNGDFKFITFFKPGLGVASSKQLLIYKDGKWVKYPAQPPAPVDLCFPLDTNTFFVTTITKFQESELYFGKNKQWENIWTPIANTISAMYFTDRRNGIVAGMGEIARLKNNNWHWLSPPNNKIITSVLIDKDSAIWVNTKGSGLFRYDASWKKIKNADKISCFRYFQDTVYVMGDNFLGIVDDNDSVSFLSTSHEIKNITSFFILNQNNIKATGLFGLILQYKNGRWKRTGSEVTENLNAIWMINDSIGWIAGDEGVLLNYKPVDSAYPEANNWKGFKTIIFNSYAKVIDDEYGVVAADFNNDGLVDIFTCGLFEANHLYINTGRNTFVDKAEQWNVSGTENVNLHELNLGACAGDFDNDGDNDLYVSVLNGRNKFYKNIRSNFFIDYSAISHGVGKEDDRTNAVISGDVDNDGDLDIFITNENSSNRLYLNNGAGIFTEATQGIGLTSKFGGTGCSFSDIDNDGDLDLYVANWSAENILYKNLLKETGQLAFENITNTAKVSGEAFSKSNAVVFSDIDNDADPDLFITNRKTSNRLYINNGKGLFIDKTSEIIGEDTLKSYGAVIADFDGDGYKDIYVSNVGQNTFYKNIDGKRFINNTIKYGAGIKGYSTGMATADFDNDGAPDLYVANYIGESSVLLRNNSNTKSFIKISATGIKNNHSGIGVKIYVFINDTLTGEPKILNYNEITGGSGYASMNQLFLPIPVQDHNAVNVKIIYPTGIIKTVEHVIPGSHIVVEDISGTQKFFSRVIKHTLLWFRDQHMLLRLLSWVFILLIIDISLMRGFKRYRWSWIYILVFAVVPILLFYFQTGYFQYKNVWLSTLFPVLSVLIFISLVHLYFERRSVKKMAFAEQELLREKLSRDLHDDLASTISTISIYLTLFKYNLKSNEKKLSELLDKTIALSGDASSAITDLIWAIKPRPESLDNLIVRINNNFSVLFREKAIRFTTQSETDMENIMLGTKTKKNVYLIIKEALNNILKYADASVVTISVKHVKQEIQLCIKDNGIGFDLSKDKNKGHGLNNMKERSLEINARYELNSAIREGTEIILAFKPGGRF